MKRRPGTVLLVLPTEQVMREFEPASTILHKVDLPLPVLAEYVIDQWAQCESEPWAKYAPREMSTFEQIMTYVVMDFLSSAEMRQMDRDDRQAAKTVVIEFCRHLFNTVVPILEQLNLTEQQMKSLNVRDWMGNSMILSVERPH